MPPENENRRRFSLFSKPLKSCVEPVMRPVIRKQGASAAKLISDWPDIAGPQVAALSTPTKLQFPKDKNNSGTLTLACESGHALNLQYMLPTLIDRLNLYFGYPAVARIQLEQTLSRNAAPKKNTAPAKPTKNIDTSCIDEITDPELKAVLESFANELAKK